MASLRRRHVPQLLARILDNPGLVASLRAVPPETLGALIRKVGVEDAGELVALASTEQLVCLFDEFLWEGSQIGDDELLEPDKLALWLHVLLEAGETFAAARLAAMPDELLCHALDTMVMVLDLDALAVLMAERQAGDDLIDKALEAHFAHELDGYLVLSKRYDGWDDVLAVLLALDEQHRELLEPILNRLCEAAMSRVQDDGLYEALTAAEQLAEDAAADREDRRAAGGYVSPADARAFLALASDGEPDDVLAQPERDAITKAYFRRLSPQPVTEPPPDALKALLAEAGVLVERAAPRAFGAGVSSEVASLRAAMRQLSEREPALQAQRVEELAYLANVLMAASSRDGRRLRPTEAADEAVAICARGLGRVLERRGGDATELLAELGFDLLFRIADQS